MNRNSVKPFLNYFRVFFISIFFLLIVAACNNDKTRPNQYYYSNEGLANDITDTLNKVNLDDNKAIRKFLENTVFISKNQKLEIDSVLNVIQYTNGKRESVMKCEISEYKVYNSRLLFLTDTTTQKKGQFTISEEGIITDMNSYARYSKKE